MNRQISKTHTNIEDVRTRFEHLKNVSPRSSAEFHQVKIGTHNSGVINLLEQSVVQF